MGYSTEHVPGPYKTFSDRLGDASFSTTHPSVDAFGTPYPPGEDSAFSRNVVQKNAHSEPDAPFQHKKNLTPYTTDVRLPMNIVKQQLSAFDYYKTQTVPKKGMKELIQKGLKNREEMIARQKESNALEMQALRDVKGKKSR